MKLFELGTNQLNYIYLLCKGIKRIDPEIQFFSFPMATFSRHYPDDLNYVFTTIFSDRFNPFYFFLAVFKSLGQKMFWRSLFFMIWVEFKFLKAAHFWYFWNLEQALFLRYPMKDFDAFHFHYLQYSYLRSVWFVPRNSKIICSFWGSDLLRTSDSFNHFFVQQALGRAAIISTDSMELKQIILAKFGRTLEPKIRIIKLAMNTSLFFTIDSFGDSDKSTLKTELGIPGGKTIVMVGHNASPFNNQLQIVSSLLNIRNREKIIVLIPFMYGSPPEERNIYRQQIEMALRGSSLEYKFLDTYLEEKDMAKLWLVTDIMIHMPQSDALSFAAVECMYTGNLMVTGSWLPYSPYRKAGLHYLEMDQVSDLETQFDDILKNIDFLKDKSRNNREGVRKYFFPETTCKEWADLLHEM